jgi:hypothetical protein
MTPHLYENKVDVLDLARTPGGFVRALIRLSGAAAYLVLA